MHEDVLKKICHNHNFHGVAHDNENKTRNVIVLTGITMGVEIIAGMLTGSMALLADGWHMGTHAFALGITYFAYVMARRFSESPQFGFGTGKFGILSAYTSALFLGGTAIYMMIEAIERCLYPQSIAFNEAILVAIVGLGVNVVSIWILHGKGAQHYDHTHHESSDRDANRYHDQNFRAAYLHVIADALTSVLAIVALIMGKFQGWVILDPITGILGSFLIARWAWRLLRSSAPILLDSSGGKVIRDAIVNAIESDGESVVGDLHVWPLSSNALATAITVVTKESRTPLDYSSRLADIPGLKHSTIEVHNCANLY